jgi:hypothetical protein
LNSCRLLLKCNHFELDQFEKNNKKVDKESPTCILNKLSTEINSAQHFNKRPSKQNTVAEGALHVSVSLDEIMLSGKRNALHVARGKCNIPMRLQAVHAVESSSTMTTRICTHTVGHITFTQMRLLPMHMHTPFTS